MKKLQTSGAAIGTLVVFSACSSLDLGGAVPVPLTDPPKDVEAFLELRALPPKFNVELNLVPSELAD